MPFRFLSQSAYTYLVEYPVATVLTVAPFRLKLGNSSPFAVGLSVFIRIAGRLELAFTDYASGLVRFIRCCLHLWVDRIAGVISTTAPSLFHFPRLDPWYCWVLATTVLLTILMLRGPELSVAQGH